MRLILALACFALVASPVMAESEAEECLSKAESLDFLLKTNNEARQSQKKYESNPSNRRAIDAFYDITEKGYLEDHQPKVIECSQRLMCPDAKRLYDSGNLPQSAQSSFGVLVKFIIDACGR